MPLKFTAASDKNLKPTDTPCSYKDKRRTGWKIPLLFCAGMLIIVGFTALLRMDNTIVPSLPNELLVKAQQITIDLDKDHDSIVWKEQITAAAGGFMPRADKDIKIESLIRTAVVEKRYDAACTAAVLMYNVFQRDNMLEHIAQSASTQCSTLPWAVIAAKGMTNKKSMSQTHISLTERWGQCISTSSADSL